MLTVNKQSFCLVFIDCTTTMVLCTSLVEHWYSHDRLRTTSFNNLFRNCKDYHMEIIPRQKFQAGCSCQKFQLDIFVFGRPLHRVLLKNAKSRRLLLLRLLFISFAPWRSLIMIEIYVSSWHDTRNDNIPLLIQKINDFPYFCKSFSMNFRQRFEFSTWFSFLVLLLLYGAQKSQTLSEITIKRSHTESNLANAEAKELSLLCPSNSLYASGLATTI